MAIAVGATLLTPGVFTGTDTFLLILLGVVIGTAIGIPAARNVKMTAMPQMVALFNGVGGGAVAIIAWIEYRHAFGGDYALRVMIPSLFAAIVGSVSFWGSLIAFGKLQEILPGRPIKLPGAAQTVFNLALLLIASPARSCSHPAPTRSCCSSSGSCSSRRFSESWSCCRSAAPTCRS